MLTALNLSHLLEPVRHRAYANLSACLQGFSDRFAQAVLQRLDSSLQIEKLTFNDSEHCENISRCLWIDQQILASIKDKQEIECIEIECGLSTRFHRLSEQTEWPRFTWCAINTFEVNDCLEYVFPQLDNHRWIACEQPQKDWIKYIHWHTSKEKILVIHELDPIQSWDEFIQLCRHIENIFEITTTQHEINFILSHRIENFLTSLSSNTALSSVHIISEHIPHTTKKSFATKLLSFFDNSLKNQKIHTHHLRIARPTKKEYLL